LNISRSLRIQVSPGYSQAGINVSINTEDLKKPREILRAELDVAMYEVQLCVLKGHLRSNVINEEQLLASIEPYKVPKEKGELVLSGAASG